MILYLNYKLKKTVFSNVCKEFLIIYGCLKSTFKKVERIENNFFFVKIQN